MNELLLQAAPQINGGEISFGIKDMITLVIGIVGVSGAFITLRLNFSAEKEATRVKFEGVQKEHDKEFESLKSDISAEKLTRHSNKKEMSRDTKEKLDVVHNRIDKTQLDFNKEIDKNREEFGKINTTMSGVKQDTAEMKGMLTTLLNK